MSTALQTLTTTLAARFGMGGGSGTELAETLKATAFKSDKPVSDAQMTALLVVANQYGLNPWTKEIYAFPDKRGGIVPVVGVDGWSRIINEHPAFDGMDLVVSQDGSECTATIYRKDRGHPTIITEYFSECKRGTDPWSSHPRRMLRHKALIQCARIAFGFGGIYDQDEAERIVEKDMGTIDVETGEVRPAAPKSPPAYPDADFEKNLPAWRSAVESGKRTVDQIISMVSSKGALTAAQRTAILALGNGRAQEPQDVDDPFVREMDAAVTAQE